ncbi:MAG: hypothetical protein QM808_00255 [Steroidobacteraceae bacterium]
MSQDTELLVEIRDLLLVIAEPSLAKRDEKLREALRKVVGKQAKGRQAVLLMDGTRSQAEIVKDTKIDQSNLSKLVKVLAKESLITSADKNPKLRVVIPQNFFEADGGGK